MRRERSEPTKNAASLPPIGGLLLPWYERERRDLPWRKNSTPYSVWVSEIMLQQTRVETVIPYFARFLDRFPSLEDLAAAPLEDVLASWSGLGYYRRARSLHAGARAVAAEHGGQFPSRLDQALEVPGVGPYTAGAILSIAYNLPVPIVDGNVERVLTRLFRIRGSPKESRNRKRLWGIAQESIPPGRASDYNQALMELGATVCTPTRPGCERCPLREVCLARTRDDVDRYPEKARAKKTVQVELHAAVVRRGDRYLLERRTTGAFLKGLWLFPFVEAANGERGEAKLLAELRRKLGTSGWRSAAGFSVRHTITFRRITADVHLVEPRDAAALERRLGSDELRWARLDELGTTIPVSSLALKIARRLR